jgi:hypothetical protein
LLIFNTTSTNLKVSKVILTMKIFPMAMEDLVVLVAPVDLVATDPITSKDLVAVDETHQPREPVP